MPIIKGGINVKNYTVYRNEIVWHSAVYHNTTDLSILFIIFICKNLVENLFQKAFKNRFVRFEKKSAIGEENRIPFLPSDGEGEAEVLPEYGEPAA